MEPIKEINKLQTPCFVLDSDELERSISGFQRALESHFSQSIIGYSVKTNSTPYCLTLAKNKGVFAEVVSYDEYELARQCGFQQNQIIYNGPMKSKDTFLDAIENGAIVNIESKRELRWLQDLPTNRFFSVGIRLNINISRVSPDDADGDNDNSRFGFSDATLEFKDALSYLASLQHVRLAGLHIHRTAHSRSLEFYDNSIKYACDIIKKYNLQLNYLDIGGGYFGVFRNKPTYQQYSDTFYKVLRAYGLENLCVIVEPGNALVASCFSFLSEVIDVKQAEDERWFVTTDGTRNDVDPFFKKTSYLEEVLYQEERNSVKEQVVAGCTCLEYDRLFVLQDRPLLGEGDRILYHNVGAYTMCLSPMFIRYIPNIYLKQAVGYLLIREKWTAQEFIQKNKK